MTEETLSDKIEIGSGINHGINVKDVKSFIKKLKEEINIYCYTELETKKIWEIIDKLAGKELI